MLKRASICCIYNTEGKRSEVQLVVLRKNRWLVRNQWESSQGKIFVVQWHLWPKDLGKSMINVFFSKHREFLKLTHTILSALSLSQLKLTDNCDWVTLDSWLWIMKWKNSWTGIAWIIDVTNDPFFGIIFSPSFYTTYTTYQLFVDNVSFLCYLKM